MLVVKEWLPSEGRAEQLILLFHGWGSSGASMAPLGAALRKAFPQAAVLAPDAPNPVDGDRPGRQWYSILDLDEKNWPERVAATVPGLRAWVQAQQQRLGVGPAATALGGFSQGAVLSLELAARHDGIAGRVLAFGGRYCVLPTAAPRHTTMHLFHGSADKVIPVRGSHDALEHLGELQGDATIDIAEGIGHELHPVLIDCALHRLSTHIPLRTWQAALGAAPAAASGVARDDH
jgi:phospholipase/carboxylesterase